MVEYVNTHTKEAAMEVLHKTGIELALFDLDDTLVKTHEVFIRQIDIFLNSVSSSLPPEQAEKFKKYFFELNRAGVHIHGISVSKERWQWITGLIGKILPNTIDAMSENMGKIEAIYQEVPKKLDGVEEVLKDFDGNGFTLGVLTHASDGWTGFKLRETGLSRYFHPSVIKTVPVNEFKQSNNWLELITETGFSPRQTIVFGNSLTSDIIPASEVGVQKLVWVQGDDPVGFFAKGDGPSGTIVIKNYGELYGEILKAT